MMHQNVGKKRGEKKTAWKISRGLNEQEQDAGKGRRKSWGNFLGDRKTKVGATDIMKNS